MIHLSKYKIIELSVLFVLLPLLLVTNFSILIKVTCLSIGVLYCISLGIYLKLITTTSLLSLPKIKWKELIFRLNTLILITTVGLYIYMPEKLFYVIKNDWLLWLSVSLIYSIASVLPQEVIYRTFFFGRYQQLFDNKLVLIITNAILFALGHLVFRNPYIIILTFIGGLLFALTYQKTKSLLYTSIEHAMYGVWLFTIGIGEYLAFPTP